MTLYGSDRYLMPPFAPGDMALSETEEARQQRYRTYLDFYNGAQWAEQRRPGERRLTVNYARAFVQKGASYLMGKPVRFELMPLREGPAAEREAAQVERALREMWDENNLAAVDFEAAMGAAIMGDAAFKVTLQPLVPGSQPSGGVLQPSPMFNQKPEKSVEVVVRALDVANLRVGWAGDDLRMVEWVEESYRLAARTIRGRYGAEALSPGTEDEARLAVCEYWTAESYRVEVEKRIVLEMRNPYGFIPYVILPNLPRPYQFWGMSDLEDIMGLNSELNVRVSVLSQLLQMSGNPVLVLENVDSAENMRVGPGAVWTLPEGAKAYLLEMIKEGGVDLHVKYIELLYKMLHDLAELPGAGFGRDDAVSAKSGVALEQLLYPVVQRVQRKRRIWEQALDLRNRMMLALAGLPIYRSRFIWPDILPKDRSSMVTQEIGMIASNIHSLQTARRNLGDEQPDLENEQIQMEWAALGQMPTSSGPAPGIRPAVRLSGALVEGLSKG